MPVMAERCAALSPDGAVRYQPYLTLSITPVKPG